MASETMERRVVVLKTSSPSSSTSLDDSFIEAVNKQLGDVVAVCGAGGWVAVVVGGGTGAGG